MAAETVQSQIPEDGVVLGRLGRAHGLKGELKFQPFGCEQDLLLEVPDIFLGPQAQSAKVLGIRGSGKHWIVALEGIENRSQAELLQGYFAWIRENQLPPLPPSDLYVASIIGAQVCDEAGTPRGQVVEVMETAENDVLIVRREDGEEELIPALRAVLTNWNEMDRVLTVCWPMGENVEN
ncbi:MAG: ribosome maturation factor RimM [bacterium]